jgi:hypothetical protein
MHLDCRVTTFLAMTEQANSAPFPSNPNGSSLVSLRAQRGNPDASDFSVHRYLDCRVTMFLAMTGLALDFKENICKISASLTATK